MANNKLYTITQAVYDVINAIPYNREFKSTDFFANCRWALKKNGNPARPFDGTLHRQMRRIRHEFNIKCVDYKRSIYMKVDEDDKQSSGDN